MIPDETPLFDPHLLEEIDWSQNTVSFSPPISPRNPGESLVLRPLCNADLNRGFFKVLGQLTKVGDVSAEDFIQKFDHVKKTGDDYVIVVVASDECRGKQLGKLLVSVLTLLSKKLDCYKVTLECKPKNFAFYEKFGYSSSDETYMQCRFFD